MPHCIVTPISKVFFYGIPSRPRWFPQIFDNWFSHFVPIPKMRECDFEFPFPFPGSKKPFPLTSVLTLTMTMMVMKTMKVMTIMTMLEEQFTRTTFPCFVPFVVDAAWPCATSSGKQHSTLPTAQTFAILITTDILEESEIPFRQRWKYLEIFVWDQNVKFWIIFSKSEQFSPFKECGFWCHFKEQYFWSRNILLEKEQTFQFFLNMELGVWSHFWG